MYYKAHHYYFFVRCKNVSLFPHKSTLISLQLLMPLLLLKRIFFATQTEIMSLQKQRIAVQFIINRTFHFYCPSLELFSSQLQLCTLYSLQTERVYLVDRNNVFLQKYKHGNICLHHQLTNNQDLFGYHHLGMYVHCQKFNWQE